MIDAFNPNSTSPMDVGVAVIIWYPSLVLFISCFPFILLKVMTNKISER